MARHAAFFKPSAERVLRKLPASAQRRIIAAAEALADGPRPAGVTKLAGDENLWRIRVGDYRVIYEIHDDRLIVMVLAIGHRRDVYRGR